MLGILNLKQGLKIIDLNANHLSFQLGSMETWSTWHLVVLIVFRDSPSLAGTQWET